jgi:hypothetical protein
MTLISSNIKYNIITKLNDIVNIEDPEWSNLGIDLKLKIVHNLCNFCKSMNMSMNMNMSKNKNKSKNGNNEINNIIEDKENLSLIDNNIIMCSMDIPLKNQRPKKIIELCGINKQINSELFNEFRKEQIHINREFRKTYNSKNNSYCFANLSDIKYKTLINNYNSNIYNFINKNSNIIDFTKLYQNLIMGNQQKIITDNKNLSNLKINKITHIDEFIYIEFNNNIQIKFELYFTSEKITSNIPAKYKIFLTNIF